MIINRGTEKHPEVFWICLSLGFLLIPTPKLFGADQSTLFSDENENYRIVITDVDDATKVSKRGKDIAIEIVDKTIGKSNLLQTFQEIRSINGCQIVYSSKAIIIADVKIQGQLAMIVDLTTGQIQDSIRCLHFSLSNSLKYFVYRPLCPRHENSIALKSTVLLYDLTEAVMENKAVDNWNRHRENWPGIPIFPVNNSIQTSSDAIFETGWIYISPLTWALGDSKLVFLAYNMNDSMYRIICVDLASGYQSPKIYKKPVRIHDLKADKYKLGKIAADKAKDNPFQLRIKEIDWIGLNKISAIPADGYYWFPDKIELSLP